MFTLLDKATAILTSTHAVKSPAHLSGAVLLKAHQRWDTPHATDPMVYRASSIGKPWVHQVLSRWIYQGCDYKENFSVAAQMRMLDGVIVQVWAETLLELGGVAFEAEGEHLYAPEGTPYTIKGHSDIVCTDHIRREIVVLECKSMASYVLKKFAENPSDTYGYLSQLSFYTKVIESKYPGYHVLGAFLLYDRSSAKFSVHPIPQFTIDAKFERIQVAFPKLTAIPRWDFDSLLNQVVIPPAQSYDDEYPWFKHLYTVRGKEVMPRHRDDIVRSLTAEYNRAPQ